MVKKKSNRKDGDPYSRLLQTTAVFACRKIATTYNYPGSVTSCALLPTINLKEQGKVSHKKAFKIHEAGLDFP